jgi:hypothetical protein
MMSRRRVVAIGACLLAFLALSVGASSCSTDTKTTADKPSNDGNADKGDAGQQAVLGDAITIEGTDTKMEVTAQNLQDPPQVGSYDEPLNKNSRFVGVDFVLKNVGDKTYSDSPSNGATLVTADGRQAESTIVTGGPCGSGFAEQATIAPGALRRGCIVFEVPGRAKVATVQFTLDSGFGPQAAEWRVSP